MKFDQKTLVWLGAAIAVALTLFGQLHLMESTERRAPPSAVVAPTPVDVSSTSPAAAAVREAKAANPITPKADGDFDFYVLVLSWSPTHCSSDNGRGRDDDLQCRSGRPYGFVLHGLWPQYERGYPQNCDSDAPRNVADAVMNEALKISPSEQLVQHEWEKHGTCSGLSQEDYFAAATLAVESVKVPRTYHMPQRPLLTTPNDVKRSFLDANKSIPKDGLAATCSRNELAEVWVCLNKDLAPRACSNDVRKKHCGARQVRMLAVRGDWPR
jgi:ribonuclease T2